MKEDIKKLMKFDDFKEFRSYYLRLGAFYGYMLGSTIMFLFCCVVFK